jgi:hypothetical protein
MQPHLPCQFSEWAVQEKLLRSSSTVPCSHDIVMLPTCRCDVDIMYVPPRFRTAKDLSELQNLPPREHIPFTGMHRLYAGCDVMVAINHQEVGTGLHLLQVGTHFASNCLP